MRATLIILTFIINQTIFGQFGFIEDKDGYVNIRSSSKNIIDTLASGQIIYCFELEGEWFPIDYDLSRQNKSGYVHKSRVRIIEDFDSFQANEITDTSITFKTEAFTLRITKIAFNPKVNNLEYHKANPSENVAIYLERINGEEIWGTDGEIPKMQYGKFILQIGSDMVNLPTDNLFEPNLDFTSVYIDKKNNIIYVSALNSEGASGYAVLWIIENGEFKQRITTLPF